MSDHLFIRIKHDHAACLPKDEHGQIWMFSQRDGSDIPQFGRLAMVSNLKLSVFASRTFGLTPSFSAGPCLLVPCSLCP
jgi:hypothetical protein